MQQSRNISRASRIPLHLSNSFLVTLPDRRSRFPMSREEGAFRRTHPPTWNPSTRLVPIPNSESTDRGCRAGIFRGYCARDVPLAGTRVGCTDQDDKIVVTSLSFPCRTWECVLRVGPISIRWIRGSIFTNFFATIFCRIVRRSEEDEINV